MQTLLIRLTISLIFLLPCFYTTNGHPTTPSPFGRFPLIPRWTAGCWDGGSFATPDPRDCYIAGHMLATMPNQLRTTSFSRNSNAGVKVPMSKTYESCALFVDMVDAQSVDISSFTEIGTRAMTILMQCVEQGPRTGGKATAGDNNKILVAIAGRARQKSKTPPLPFTSEVSVGSNRLIPH